MNGTITALIIAIVGVCGTLTAPIVSQRLSARARREEFDQQRLQKADEYARGQQRETFAAKRSCYIALFVATRRYRVELMNYLHTVNQGKLDDNARSRLEDARFTFHACVSEAQLTGSLAVLEELEPIRVGTTKAYGAIRSLEYGDPEPDGSFEEIKAFLFKIWDNEWPRVQRAMRADLGVAD